MEQLAGFMGHTLGVHKGSYRLPNDLYQTAKISKLLLLMEQGKAAEYKGKALTDIELDLEEDLMATQDTDSGDGGTSARINVYPELSSEQPTDLDVPKVSNKKVQQET